jgi:hypothetical protein
VTTSPPPESAVPAATPPRSWRKRHPVLARTLLYGGMLAVLGAGAWGGAALLEESRQGGLLTTIQGTEQIREVDPERALRILREDVLAKNPNADVRRRALLSEAAVLDFLRRYDDGDRAYAAIEADWPAGTPKGPLYVPWANLRVSAGRFEDGLRLLDAPGATEGWPEDEVAAVRARARAGIEAAKVAPGAPGSGRPPSAGGD